MNFIKYIKLLFLIYLCTSQAVLSATLSKQYSEFDETEKLYLEIDVRGQYLEDIYNNKILNIPVHKYKSEQILMDQLPKLISKSKNQGLNINPYYIKVKEDEVKNELYKSYFYNIRKTHDKIIGQGLPTSFEEFNKEMNGDNEFLLRTKNNRYLSSVIEVGNRDPEIAKCSYNSKNETQNNYDTIFCLLNQKTIPIPKFHKIKEIFCENSKNINDCIKFIDKKKLILKSDFPKIEVKTFQQNLKIKDRYIPVIGMNSLLIKKSPISHSNILFSKVLKKDTYKIDQQFRNCLEAKNCKYIKNTDSIKHRIFFYFGEKFSNYQCELVLSKGNDIHLQDLSLHVAFKQNKTSILRPVLRVKCFEKGLSQKNSVMVLVDALNGAIFSKIRKFAIIHNSLNNNENFSELVYENYFNDTIVDYDIKNIKISDNFDWRDSEVKNTKAMVLNRINKISHLFQSIGVATESSINKSQLFQSNSMAEKNNAYLSNTPKEIYINKNCSNKCGHNMACANDSLVCLANGTNIDGHSFASVFDVDISVHEYLHAVLPHMFGINEISTTNIDLIFHDFTDSLTVAYTGEKCIGRSLFNGPNPNCIVKTADLPRKIDTEDSIYNYIPVKNSEYKQGEITANILLAASTLLKSQVQSDESEIYENMKHFIRTYRAMLMFQFTNSPCYDCDEDFYSGLQNIANAYWFQLLESSDHKYLPQLFFEWSKNGLILESIDCIKENYANTHKCESYDANNHTVVNTGISTAFIEEVNIKNKNLTLIGQTGLGLNFNQFGNMVVNNHCNQYVKLEFFNASEPEQIVMSTELELKMGDLIKKHCTYNVTIEFSHFIFPNGKNTDDFITNYNNKNISYKVSSGKLNKFNRIIYSKSNNFNNTLPLAKLEQS